MTAYRKYLLAPAVLGLVAAFTVALAQQSAKEEAAAPSWIWMGEQPEQDQTVFFRKEFELDGPAAAAKLCGTCDNRMDVFVNGVRVLRGTEWEVPVCADVRDRLKKGKNVIAVRARNEGSAAGLLLRLTGETEGKKTFAVVTDATWQVAAKPRKGWQTADFDASGWGSATVVGSLGDGPWTQVNAKTLASAENPKRYEATPLDRLKVKPGFEVELVYSVPKETQGSWVSMCAAPGGKLIVSDQYGKLYRVTPCPVGGSPEQTKVEPIPVDLGEAQGLLWAFDSLYVVVNRGEKYSSGLYRVTDSNGDGELDRVQLLRPLQGGGEHGPHAVVLAPDGKSLFVCCGNHTATTKFDAYRVPPVWGEDQLLPRQWDARGHARGILAPGGWIARVDPEGKSWEIWSNGYRNEYDIAFNRHGDLFTYDSDMEWDMNTPWYRPTRVCFAASGSEFGWRSGTGKWPAYYPDSLPSVLDIGPGSPTGVTFGYGAKFPAKYQEAFYICDWSYGKLYAVHLKPEGAGYTGEAEEFITGTPLPLTDIVVLPEDGAMYFAIGGRRAQSGLYRVTYTGDEPTAPSPPDGAGAEARELRRKLEAFHGRRDPKAVETAWPHLGSGDRYLRFAARVALEFQDPASWQQKALAEKDPQTALTALLALTRVGDKGLQPQVLEALARLKWEDLSYEQKLELLRVYALTFIRLAPPDDAARRAVIAKLDPHYPAGGKELNAELSKLLVYLEAPSAAAKTMKLMREALTQEEQMDYA
ncbi:MAG TPA: heme-binding protein, partial [Gemmataceae bacterium]